MLNEIQSNAFANQIQSTNIGDQPIRPNFCGKIQDTQPDKFELSTKADKTKSKLEIAALAVTGAVVGALALTRAKLGKILKLVGEEVPFTIKGRLSKLTNIAAKDGMTGLFNKKALLTDVAKEYHNAQKTGGKLSVGMLDMDNFKGVNEVFSHDTGDIVLKRIAANINDVAQEHGIKGFRYGGEEFVVSLPGHDGESAQKIMTKISDAIKNDEVIQSYVPEFLTKAKGKIDFITPRRNQINDIFTQLKSDKPIENPQKLADSISTLIKEHIETFEPSDTKALTEISQKLKSAKSEEELRSILKTDSPCGKDSTLGNELNKIFNQYTDTKNDLIKWVNHINEHKMFTVSGGVVDLADASETKNGESLIKLADAALKSAKENGKNTVVVANNDVIEKTLGQINK